MGLVILLLICALVFFGVGAFVVAAKWALIFGLIFLVGSALLGLSRRSR